MKEYIENMKKYEGTQDLEECRAFQQGGEILRGRGCGHYSQDSPQYRKGRRVSPKKFSIESFSTKVHTAISASTSSIPLQKEEEKLYVKCYSTSRFYGQLKTHKEDCPIRPVVACHSSPAFWFAKYLTLWFRECTNFAPQQCIRNSEQLANELKDLRFTPDIRLVSWMCPQCSPVFQSRRPSTYFTRSW